MSMNSSELHEKAMQLAAKADKIRRKAQATYALAAEPEERAAEQCTDHIWKAVLYRSAAWLALHGARFREAIRLAERGLNVAPPEEIAAELRDVIEQAKASE